MDRKKNSTTITGRKLSTAPTPPNTPSIISECIHSDTPARASAASVTPVSASMPLSSRSESVPPIGPNVR